MSGVCLGNAYDPVINVPQLFSWVWLMKCDDEKAQAPVQVSDWYHRKILRDY